MSDALVAALAGRGEIVVARGIDAVAQVREAGARHDMVLVVIGETVPDLDRAMLIAALGPLAGELAPATRLAALDLAAGADPSDIAAAAHFLASAASTTGQVLRITPRQSAPPRSHGPSERTTSA